MESFNSLASTLPLTWAVTAVVLVFSLALYYHRAHLHWKEPQTITISKILVHPIKSCRGTSVSAAAYNPEGLENDRQWCIIDAETNAVITARENPEMVLIHPQIMADKTSPHGGFLAIILPEVHTSFNIYLCPTEEVLQHWKKIENISLWSSSGLHGYVCESPEQDEARSSSAILSDFLNRPVHLIYKGPKVRACSPTVDFPELDASLLFQDGYPLLVLSQESVGEIENVARQHIGQQGIEAQSIEIERFRPNLILSGAGPFAEDNWLEIGIGADIIQARAAVPTQLVSRCSRCLLPNINTQTGIRDAAVPYKVLMKFRTGLDPLHKYTPIVGCNAATFSSGIWRVGDVIHVRKLRNKV